MGDVSQYFKDYGEEIYRYLRRLVDDEEAARDLLQETFLKAMRYTIEEEKAKSYIYRIAHSLAMDYFREKAHYSSFPLLEERIAANPVDEDDYNEIWNIPNSQEKGILLLYYQEKYSCQEIADRLNIPLNTVKSHLHRAKKKIYNFLKGDN